MSFKKRAPGRAALDLVTSLLRAWAAGFGIAARGTWWALRQALRVPDAPRGPKQPPNKQS
jgi:hypothetical protein